MTDQSALELAEFTADLTAHAYRVGKGLPPDSLSADEVAQICRLAHKQYGVNDDTERDWNLRTLEMLATDLACDLDWENKAFIPWDEDRDPLTIPRLEEPEAPAAPTTEHLVLTHYEDDSEARPTLVLYYFTATEVDAWTRRAQFQAAYSEAYQAADGDTSDDQFDIELAKRGIAAEMNALFAAHDWSHYEQCFYEEG